MQTIRLPCYGIELELEYNENHELGGTITMGELDPVEFATEAAENDYEKRSEIRAALDMLSSVILAHAVAGIDVDSPAYVQGIETAAENMTNTLT
jgi:hypothetical protein